MKKVLGLLVVFLFLVANSIADCPAALQGTSTAVFETESSCTACTAIWCWVASSPTTGQWELQHTSWTSIGVACADV